ncbi:MAG: GAF domain-containing protein [Anaerolineaceae bacterium]|nr:GAF domain-containing protein [Anaerolineaceae bacterium]
MNTEMIPDSNETLKLLYELSGQLAGALDLQTTLEKVTMLTAKYIGSKRGSLVVLDVDKKPIDAVLIFEGRMQFNNAAQFVDVVRNGLIGWVVEHREAVFIDDTSKDDRWLKRMDDDQEHTGAKSAMCIPLAARNQLVGVLTIVHPGTNVFSQDQFAFLKAVAGQAGVAIHNALLYNSQELMHRQYYELFEDNIAPILISDQDGKINKANRAAYELVGWTDNELVGASIFDLHSAPLQKLGSNFEKLNSGDMISYESLLAAANDEFLPVKFSVRMQPRDVEGNIQWMIEDISSQKQMEEMRHDLLSMVYHDIRSPLSNVISSLELMRMLLPVDSDPAIEEVFSVMSRSSNRIQRLVSNLLDIDRMETGQDIVNARMVDLNVLIDVVSADIKPLIESRKQHYTLKINKGVDDVWADEDMLRRVLINLLENASKYTPAKGNVELSIQETTDDMLRFMISDNGPGIPEKLLPTIFEKFTRVNSKSVPKGIGLGLSFCRLAVEAHDGRIWVESEENQGTRFIFELPSDSGKYCSPFR